MLITEKESLIINKSKGLLPEKGIICAHPGRARRIATEFFDNYFLHTDYRGYQIYTGQYQDHEVFVANTGIGAPAAAFLLEEMIGFGARRILRLGSNDGKFTDYKLNVVEKTTLPLGLCHDYDFSQASINISKSLKYVIQKSLEKFDIPSGFTTNRHIDGYFPVNFSHLMKPSEFGSQDMESGALYLISYLRKTEYLSLLISYPKHETSGEYQDGGKSRRFEESCIKFSLELLLKT